MVYGFLGFATLLILLVIGYIVENCIKKRHDNDSKCKGNSDGCDPNQCDFCQIVTNES